MKTAEIVKKLKEAKHTYYNTDSPIMSDAEFDKLEDRLRKIDPNNDYFKIVGADTYGQKVKHSVPMRSLNKANSIKEVEKWLQNRFDKRVPIIIEHKIDGLSLECRYNKGKFVCAVTRGNGKVGMDVTNAARYIKSIPKTITWNDKIAFRGEIVLFKNTKFPTNGKPLRNIATGLLGRKTGRSDCKYLNFLCYNVVNYDGFIQEHEKFSFCVDNGFDIPVFHYIKSLKEIEEIYNDYIKKQRDKLNYEIDGLVLVPDDITVQESLEDNDEKAPKWSMALKLPPESKKTIFEDIIWTVSRHGNIIPTAKVKEVIIGGRHITKTSLSNYKNVVKMKLEKSDEVLIEMANDVIPYLAENITKGIKQRLK